MYLVQGEFWWSDEKQLAKLLNLSTGFFIEAKENASMEIIYTLEFNEDSLKSIVRGLDCSIRLMAGQIVNAQNASGTL